MSIVLAMCHMILLVVARTAVDMAVGMALDMVMEAMAAKSTKILNE